MSFGERITASDELADDLMDADEEDTDGVWLHVEDEAGLAAFEENQYLVRKPLKLLVTGTFRSGIALPIIGPPTISLRTPSVMPPT